MTDPADRRYDLKARTRGFGRGIMRFLKRLPDNRVTQHLSMQLLLTTGRRSDIRV